ncbi:MAG: DUF1573 domain-containing protein [Planctomycetes bacterium]|jgi:hypothetical protein|nr:DUF1573 domain-containing protein [Planctomycetota bacterium]MCP4837889.1 DUF1573 domain-containing protein [Planctomycetota bacterium]
MGEGISSNSRGIRSQLIGLGIIAVVLILVVYFWPRASVSGERLFDFGLVEYDRPPHVLEHVFNLKNVGDEPLEVERFKSTCGCTQASGSGRVAHPNEVLNIPITLRLSRSGPKEGVVTVSFSNGTSVDLVLRAIGRPRETLKVRPAILHLRSPLGTGEVFVFLEADTKPPVPTIETPERLAADFQGWEQIEIGDADSGEMSVWRGQLKFKGVGGWPGPDIDVTVRMPDDQVTKIRINPVPPPLETNPQTPPQLDGPPSPGSAY